MDDLPLSVLQICNKPPYPSLDGGCLAMDALTRGLLAFNHQVKVLAACSYKHPYPDLSAEYIQETRFEAVFIDLKPRPIKAFFNLFGKHSYILERFYTHDFADRLKKVLQTQKFDIVQIESVFMAMYIPLIRKYAPSAKICIRTHNVEHKIWERLSLSAKSPLRSLYFRLLAARLKKEEIYWLSQADAVLSITRKDAENFTSMGIRKPIKYIPFGLFDALLPVEPSVESPSLCYLGAMNWMPNEEGIRWFLEKVWPSVNEKYPDLKFYIAGRMMPAWLTNASYPNVFVMGEVEDAKTFMSSKAVFVVPLLSGSGVRVKIIEAMATARPVITSSIGAQGIDYKHRENIWIADSPEQYMEAISFAVKDAAGMERIGKNARELILREHDNMKICLDLSQYYKTL